MEKSNVYLITILITMASLSSLSHGIVIPGYNITKVVIEDAVYCRINGEPDPVSNAPVFLKCGGSNISLAETTTDLNGVFTIVLDYVRTALFSPSFCGLVVNLPPGYSCALVTPDGVLNSTLRFVKIVGDTIFFAAGIFM
ncbi:unnamed protein product [Microthlaspi erraticum]|uniref:Pollen Ole e 1 allergen and extensin family protein n=1 Tax=Microthlaspi erraticum TaxID=1685480 RepID=A0A6D2LGI0_9BRAS|nr:unnamed protein product [Microthlaspi erraticum]CAA7059320.1 unnamed protein product [Microthlaspi erraticum]